MATFQRILVPVDFSAHAEEAQRIAIELSRELGASLTLLHIYQPATVAIPEPVFIPAGPPSAEVLAAATTMLERAADTVRTSGGKVEDVRTVLGTPFLEIVRFAKEGGFDLIVMGTHGYTGLKHVFLGSVAEKVVRKAPCAVLVVRLPEHRFEQP